MSTRYSDLLRDIGRVDNGREVYATGTVTVTTNTTCTLTGGVWPTWIVAGTAIHIGSDAAAVAVASRTNDTVIVLSASHANVATQAYVLYEDDVYAWEKAYDAINAGLRKFYYPQALKGTDRRGNTVFDEMHEWSFLKPTQSLALSDADYDYDLPDDYGQSSGVWTHSSFAGPPMREIPEPQLMAMRATDAQSGVPKYVALRPKTSTGADGQRFEALFYPTPDASYTVQNRYTVNPNALTPAAPYPYGGLRHADTIRSAVLAAWELDSEDMRAEREQRFVERLEASIRLDQKTANVTGNAYLVGTVTRGTYEWLQQEVGKVKGFTPNFKTWDHATTQDVHSVIVRGISQVLSAPAMGDRYRHHRWSWLRPTETLTTSEPYSTGTVTIVSGVVTLSGGTFPSWAADGEMLIDGVIYTVDTRDSGTQVTLEDLTVTAAAGTEYVLEQFRYDLPSTFGGMAGDVYHQPGNSTLCDALQQVSTQEILRLRTDAQTGRPIRYALIPETPSASTGTRWQIALWPVPDDDYPLTYQYRVHVAEIAAGEYLIGGPDLYELHLASCLAVAEGVDGEQFKRFQRLAAAAIEQDRSDFAAESVGISVDPDEYESYRSGPSFWRGVESVTYDNTSL